MKKFLLLITGCWLAGCSLLPQNAPSGTYRGTLPCADCEKIEAKLVLNYDHSYRFEKTYFLKNNKKQAFVEQGRFVWDKQKSRVIRLPKSGNQALFVADDYLELCDPQGNLATSGLNYKLNKIR